MGKDEEKGMKEMGRRVRRRIKERGHHLRVPQFSNIFRYK